MATTSYFSGMYYYTVVKFRMPSVAKMCSSVMYTVVQGFQMNVIINTINTLVSLQVRRMMAKWYLLEDLSGGYYYKINLKIGHGREETFNMKGYVSYFQRVFRFFSQPVEKYDKERNKMANFNSVKCTLGFFWHHICLWT